MDVFLVTPYDLIEGLFLEIPGESWAVVLYGVLTALYLVPYRVYAPSVVAAAIPGQVMNSPTGHCCGHRAVVVSAVVVHGTR